MTLASPSFHSPTPVMMTRLCGRDDVEKFSVRSYAVQFAVFALFQRVQGSKKKLKLLNLAHTSPCPDPPLIWGILSRLSPPRATCTLLPLGLVTIPLCPWVSASAHLRQVVLLSDCPQNILSPLTSSFCPTQKPLRVLITRPVGSGRLRA